MERSWVAKWVSEKSSCRRGTRLDSWETKNDLGGVHGRNRKMVQHGILGHSQAKMEFWWKNSSLQLAVIGRKVFKLPKVNLAREILPDLVTVGLRQIDGRNLTYTEPKLSSALKQKEGPKRLPFTVRSCKIEISGQRPFHWQKANIEHVSPIKNCSNRRKLPVLLQALAVRPISNDNSTPSFSQYHTRRPWGLPKTQPIFHNSKLLCKATHIPHPWLHSGSLRLLQPPGPRFSDAAQNSRTRRKSLQSPLSSSIAAVASHWPAPNVSWRSRSQHGFFC